MLLLVKSQELKAVVINALKDGKQYGSKSQPITSRQTVPVLCLQGVSVCLCVWKLRLEADELLITGLKVPFFFF